MHPITHFLVGWTVACSGTLDRRDRAIVALAGVAPDLDGLGIIAELATRHSEQPLLWWTEYHHVLAHNLGGALVAGGLAAALAIRKRTTAVLTVVSFHLHLVGDLVGSRGPEGYQWPIPYLLPFSDAWDLAWDGQWQLNAWPNIAITVVLLASTFVVAWKRGYSPVELFSAAADRAFIDTLRRRFPPS